MNDLIVELEEAKRMYALWLIDKDPDARKFAAQYKQRIIELRNAINLIK